MAEHVVEQGECFASIAFAAGFSPQALWNHPDNAGLKGKRKDPGVLLPGDTVVIPELTVTPTSGATGARHKFKRKGVPIQFKVQLLKQAKPRANLPWNMTVDGVHTTGATDGDGFVTAKIPPNASQVTIRLHDGKQTCVYEFALGSLDPLDADSGLKQRLASLGFTSKDDIAGAISAFQASQNISVTGQLDDATRAKLKERYGR